MRQRSVPMLLLGLLVAATRPALPGRLCRLRTRTAGSCRNTAAT